MATAQSTNGLDESNRIDLLKLPEPEVAGEPVTGERYYSEEFMQKEWEHVWTKTWLIAGLEEQLQKSGDRFTCEVGKESILCTRDDEGVIRAFYNVCQHRGNRLVHEESSSGKIMACNYHGWRFKPNGELAFVPDAKDFSQGNPCGKLRLKELPCTVFAGFVWYSMDEDVMSLEEFLGPVYAQISTYDMSRMKRTHWVTIEGDFNWKVVQDNFNESFHLPFVHLGSKHILEQSYKHCQMDIFEKEGHARMIMPGDKPTVGLKSDFDTTKEILKEQFEFWGLDPEKFRDDPQGMRVAMQKIKRELGAEKGFDYSGMHDEQLTDHFHYTIFPNLSLSLKPDGCIFLKATPHPTDPSKCYFDTWFLMWFPDNATEYYAAAMDDTVSLDVQVPHVTGKVREVSCGPVIDDDVRVWSTQQKGLMSKGFNGSVMADQEKRVQFFHEEVDRYIARGEARS